LLEKGLIDDQAYGNGFGDFAKRSLPADWVISAQNYFDRDLFKEAGIAFRKAKDERAARIADAYALYQDAEKVPPRAKERIQAYADTATAFYRCALASANVGERAKFFSTAGKCFSKAAMYREAAGAYIRAFEYNEAASQYLLGQMLDEAIALVMSYPVTDAELVDEIKSLGKYVYLSDHRLK